MSKYYHGKRTKNIYDPKSIVPFRLSRSRIESFLQCARCFYIDRRLGVDRPQGFPLTLNTAVDTLLKKEFDIHRAAKTAHPLMKTYGIDAIPFAHSELNVWRENFIGAQFHHEKSGFLVTGAVDDVWVNRTGELMIVDYKATAKENGVSIDSEWQISYKRQMEIYQWLFRNIGFKVSDTGYFVYVNGRTDRKAFDGKLEFDVRVIPYQGKADWVDDVLLDIRKCLRKSTLPKASMECDYCRYRAAVREVVEKK